MKSPNLLTRVAALLTPPPSRPVNSTLLSENKDPNTMNPRKPIALLVSLFSFIIVSDPLVAQTAAPAAKDEVLVLSPFVVNAERDTGYQATSTLAGTRLNTPLKDLGASISVYTKDFLNDIGSTSSSDLLIYATGMEAAGPGGNFSGVIEDINATHVIGDSVRTNPQQSRSRGLGTPNFTRGFFLTGIRFDSYNIGQVTVNRGPNAALFGVGNPAGVVDQSLLLPDLHRNSNQVVMRYGNNDSLRGSIDLNRVLIDKKLALRIAALHESEEYNQRPAFQEQKRIYGALTFEPFKATSLRANFESGQTRANRPITVLPYKSITDGWLALGPVGFDWSYYDDPARNPNAAAQQAGSFQGPYVGQGQIFDTLLEVYAEPNSGTSSYAFRAVTQNTGGNAANRVKNQLFNQLVNRDKAADNIYHAQTLNIAEISGRWWGYTGVEGTGPTVLPGQLPDFAPVGIKYQGFTDFNAFDFKNRMIDETSRQGDSFHAFNVALEQRAWEDRVGIEFAYATERVDSRAQNAFFQQGNTNHIRIDVNVTLPTGEPNPNLGRPYATYDWGNWTKSSTERETSRITGYLKYDFKDLRSSWGRWLGSHTLTGLYENYAIENVSYSYRLAVTDSPAATALNPSINAGPRRAVKLVYLGPSVIGSNSPLRLQPIQIPPPSAGLADVPVRYFVRAADATDPGHFEDVPFSYTEINRGGGAEREVIKSQAAVLQSYLLQDHLITTLGWRRDEDYFARKGIGFVANPENPGDPGKVHYGLNDFSFPRTPPPTVADETKSFGAVLRWPRKLIKLPAGTDFSLFYNRSENFTPLGGRHNAYGELLYPPKGKTREYGFNFSAFDNKLDLRVTRFETAAVGATYAASLYNWATSHAMFHHIQSWAVEANINPHLAELRNAQIELLFSALPADFRELYGWKVTGEAPNIVATYNPNPGVDTTDFTAKGMEFELIYNPTRNWRILLNVAKQETVQSNSMPFLKDFFAKMTPIWNQLREQQVPQNNYPLGWQIGDPLPIGTPLYVRDYLENNVLVPFATALATEGSASPEQRKWRANLVTNYTFGRDSIFDGKLNGWGIGASVRWQDKIGIGYPTSRNPDTSANIDIAHPYYNPAETNVDAWVSYETKLWNDRFGWKVQLNVRNLYGKTGLIPINVQPWGEIATVRLAPERRWYLTSTFSF